MELRVVVAVAVVAVEVTVVVGVVLVLVVAAAAVSAPLPVSAVFLGVLFRLLLRQPPTWPYLRNSGPSPFA